MAGRVGVPDRADDDGRGLLAERAKPPHAGVSRKVQEHVDALRADRRIESIVAHRGALDPSAAEAAVLRRDGIAGGHGIGGEADELHVIGPGPGERQREVARGVRAQVAREEPDAQPALGIRWRASGRARRRHAGHVGQMLLRQRRRRDAGVVHEEELHGLHAEHGRIAGLPRALGAEHLRLDALAQQLHSLVDAAEPLEASRGQRRHLRPRRPERECLTARVESLVMTVELLERSRETLPRSPVSAVERDRRAEVGGRVLVAARLHERVAEVVAVGREVGVDGHCPVKVPHGLRCATGLGQQHAEHLQRIGVLGLHAQEQLHRLERRLDLPALRLLQRAVEHRIGMQRRGGAHRAHLAEPPPAPPESRSRIAMPRARIVS